MDTIKAKIRMRKDQCNEERCNPRLNLMVQRKAAAKMMAFKECLEIIQAEEERLESTSSLPIGDVGRSYLPKCTRVEVIDKGGRAYVNYDCTNVEAHLQDDDRTLKVFIV